MKRGLKENKWGFSILAFVLIIALIPFSSAQTLANMNDVEKVVRSIVHEENQGMIDSIKSMRKAIEDRVDAYIAEFKFDTAKVYIFGASSFFVGGILILFIQYLVNKKRRITQELIRQQDAKRKR